MMHDIRMTRMREESILPAEDDIAVCCLCCLHRQPKPWCSWAYLRILVNSPDWWFNKVIYHFYHNWLCINSRKLNSFKKLQNSNRNFFDFPLCFILRSCVILTTFRPFYFCTDFTVSTILLLILVFFHYFCYFILLVLLFYGMKFAEFNFSKRTQKSKNNFFFNFRRQQRRRLELWPVGIPDSGAEQSSNSGWPGRVRERRGREQMWCQTSSTTDRGRRGSPKRSLVLSCAKKGGNFCYTLLSIVWEKFIC